MTSSPTLTVNSGPLPAVTLSPTIPQILPRITDAPSDNDYPIEVVVQLTTTLLIPDYPLYYNTPISEFNPNYEAFPDGSLIAAPYRSDLEQASAELLMLSILITIFLRNVFVSGNYIRRVKVRRKILFRTMFITQAIAFVGLIPQIISFLGSHLNCTGVILAADVAAALSIVGIMTGILGYKAYKCLGNSIFVLLIVSLLTIGVIGVSFMDFITLRGAVRLSGSCIRTDNMKWTKFFIVLQLGESLFLCCCYLYAVWTSRNSPVVKDRISVRLSMDFQPSEKQRDRRDFMPLGHRPEEELPGSPSAASHSAERRLSKTNEEVGPLDTSLVETSVYGQSSLTMSSLVSRARSQQDEIPSTLLPQARPLSRGPTASLAPSTLSRISHYMPGLFRKVMKDELYYTTMITAVCVIVGLTAVVGVSSKGHLWFLGWVCLYWVVASVLATHSLGRAVRRHEREAILQDAALHQKRWEYRATPLDRRNNSNFSSNRWIKRKAPGTDSDNLNSLYSDTRALTSAYRDSVPGSVFSSASGPRSSSYSKSSYPLCPSPTFQFPSSGRTTPLVPLDSTRACPSRVRFYY
ncbi:hypothetical protein BT96DRAFT_243693 [Gymnopus androsaceus JB14]|uniref:Uncharacterized protein n=1 Tax=Gymnopus androsaceus JB14 TaxID=1447944 RepID=A0A6A4IK07_9AGAR|nr:hypothetical protein BT96DRAFT_243693 [Gymnopus androsaceus JB14]